MSKNGLPEELECNVTGKRLFRMWNEEFEVDERYVPERCIGKGAYGIVCRALDTTTGVKVAIKKIVSAFGHYTQAIRCLREVNLLRHIRHPNIIQIRGIMKPRYYANFDSVYVVYDCMDTDLHQIIRSGQELTDGHCKFLIMQTLRGLLYLHSANIIHRDLKPSNLLVNSNCDLKIADFGLARARDCRNDFTQYVVTRYYRPPEVLLQSDYTTAIDMWSVGCILGELLMGTPLFQGKDQFRTLQNVVNLLGKPTDDDLQGYASSSRLMIQQLPQKERCLETQFPRASAEAVDLLSSLLQYDPRKRPTAKEALEHPWFNDCRCPSAEVIAQKPFEYEFDEDALKLNDIRRLMAREIQTWAGDRCTPREEDT